jgi:hypothetical protein
LAEILAIPSFFTVSLNIPYNFQEHTSNKATITSLHTDRTVKYAIKQKLINQILLVSTYTRSKTKIMTKETQLLTGIFQNFQLEADAS